MYFWRNFCLTININYLSKFEFSYIFVLVILLKPLTENFFGPVDDMKYVESISRSMLKILCHIIYIYSIILKSMN